MNTYMLVVFAHIAAAAVLVGGSMLAAPGVRAAARRARTPQELGASLAVGRPLYVVDPVAALAVLASGVYLTSVTHWWSAAWVQIATALWVLSSITSTVVVKPAVQRLAAEAAAAVDGPIDQRLNALRWSRRWSLGGDLLFANDAAVLFLMVMKPGPAGSILAVVLVNALVLGGGAALRRLRFIGVKPTGAPPLAQAGGA